MAIFSIIIPVFNAEKYLHNCLCSIRDAIIKFGQVVEVICVDDGSNDRSLQMMESFEWGSEYIKVKTIHQHNAGVSVARNRGLAIASGEYICFVDADDTVSEDWLCNYATAFSKYDCDLVRCDPSAVEVGIYSGMRLCEWGWNTFVKDGFPWKYSIRRTVAIRACFPEGVAMSEDSLYAARVLPYISSAIQYPGMLYHHCVHPGSAMSKQLKSVERLQFMSALCEIAGQNPRAADICISRLACEGILTWLDRPADIEHKNEIRRVWFQLKDCGYVRIKEAGTLFYISYAMYALTGWLWPSMVWATLVRFGCKLKRYFKPATEAV